MNAFISIKESPPSPQLSVVLHSNVGTRQSSTELHQMHAPLWTRNHPSIPCPQAEGSVMHREEKEQENPAGKYCLNGSLGPQ